MKKVNHDELKEILNVMYMSKRAVFLWGDVGIGKSESVKEFSMNKANELKRKFVEWNKLTKKEKLEIENKLDNIYLYVDLRASQFDLGDFKLPNFLKGDGVYEWSIPILFKVLSNEKTYGTLFFDEFNLAPKSVQSMFYQLINDRQIGENKISDNVFIIGAGNELSDYNDVYEMNTALLDRFEHVFLSIPTIEDWTKWAIKHNVNREIISFLNFKPIFLHKVEPEEKAFPTPRGWFYLSKQLEHVDIKNLNLVENIVSVNVGYKVAIEFVSYLKLKNKISINDILNNPNKVKEINEVDILYTIITELSNQYERDKKKLDKILDVLKNIDNIEIVIMGLNFLIGIDKRHVISTITKKSKYDWILKYKEYLI